MLWFTLNVLVMTRLALDGAVTSTTLTASATLIPALVVAVAAGEWVHHRVSERGFRWLVALLLLTTGCILLARTLAA